MLYQTGRTTRNASSNGARSGDHQETARFRPLNPHRLLTVLVFAASIGTSVHALAQCPLGDVVLSDQTQVDQFAIDYPDCTEIEGDLTINYSLGEPIIDLTPLSGLTSVTGALRLERLFFYDEALDETIVTSLEGLENITNVGHLYIGSPFDLGATYLFDDLSPLNGLSGSIGEFWIRRTEVLSPLPDFPFIETIGYFRMANVGSVTTTPVFSGLTAVRDFTVVQNAFVPNSALTTVIMPSGVTSISNEFDPNEEITGVYFQNLPFLEEIIGGESLASIQGDVVIRNTPSLATMIGFDHVTTVGNIDMSQCHSAPFISFPNLEEASYITLELGNNCDEFNETAVTVTIGSNALTLNVTGPTGLNFVFSEVVEITFTGNFNILGNLRLDAFNATTINGFETVTHITGDLEFRTPMLEALPSFNSLTTIDERLWLIPFPGATWALSDLSGLESLASLGHLRISPPGTLADHQLQSLDGLSGLSEITGSINLRSLPNLSNIDALGDELSFSGNLTLQNLTSLQECSSSSVICHLVSSAESSSFSNNGSGCDDVDDLLVACSSAVFDQRINHDASLMMYFDHQSQWNIEAMAQGHYDLFLFDLAGRVLFSETVYLNEGANGIALPGSLSSGIFMAHWRNETHSGTVKLFHSVR